MVTCVYYSLYETKMYDNETAKDNVALNEKRQRMRNFINNSDCDRLNIVINITKSYIYQIVDIKYIIFEQNDWL